MSKFVITGLPRSRTAWFSAYFTYGDIICYHEAFYHGIPLEGAKHVGNADCGYFVKDWDIGEHGLVIIHRDPEDVARSLYRIGLDEGIEYLPMVSERLYELDGLHVDYDDIDDRLEEIHDYLGLPGYDKKRAELFRNMNIQSTAGLLAAHMELEKIRCPHHG